MRAERQRRQDRRVARELVDAQLEADEHRAAIRRASRPSGSADGGRGAASQREVFEPSGPNEHTPQH